jgi:hypothetical protein
MRSLPDRLNDQIERQRRGERAVSGPKEHRDAEVEELAQFARRLQFTPQLRPDPRFVQRLEMRVLAQQAAQSHQHATSPRRLFQPLRLPLAVGIALACLLLVITAGTFTVAAQVSNPSNPLYRVNRWVQQMQQSESRSVAVDQARADWQKANTQVTTLASHAKQGTYRQSLMDMDQQIKKLEHSIQALPSGPEKEDFSHKLTTLKAQARQTLRGLLPRLTLSEKLQTTDELGTLGDDTLPQIESARMVVTHPQMQATITIIGEHFHSGAQAVVDTQIVTSRAGSQAQDGSMVFIMEWSGTQSPKTIGILNPDGTLAQTTLVTFTVTNGNATNKGEKNNNGSDNASNKGKNGKSGSQGNAQDNGVGNTNTGNGKGKGKGKGNTTATPTVTP